MYKQDTLGFEIWVKNTYFNVDAYQCVAQFYFWQECLDYKEYILKSGIDCYIRTLQPSGTSYRTELREFDKKN